MKKFIALLLLVLLQFVFVPPQKAYAAQVTVDLGTAASFAILAGTPGITETGGHTSAVTGDVGLSPATASGIELYCSQVTGTIYGVDAAYVGDGGLNACFAGNPPLSNKTLVDNAKLDLTTAYNDAAGRTPVSTINTELGGQTLVPGVYASGATTFGITAGAGPLVLDAQGDPSAVFIFQVSAEAPGLIVGPGSVVSLANGACASNIFWRVDSAAINTTAVFKGNILALNSITVADGANIEGRLLARNGQVTLSNDTINLPTTCAAVNPSALTSAGAPSSSYCPPTSYVTPIIIESRRVDADSVFLSWGPYSGVNTFIVQYGTENGKWLYNTRVTGFSTTINNLPANTPIWARVVATDYCSEGVYGAPKLVGGPGLPNTGFAPNEKSIPWFVPAGIFVGISTLLLIQRKYRFLSGH